jgi:GrpB-like predicted nucleotidyltransferase (UPF0157 family)
MDPLPPFLAFEHVGSTAVAGAGGKPVIDLLALYEDGSLEETKRFLLGIGFGTQGSEFSRAWPKDRPMYLGSYQWDNESFLIYVHVVHKASDEVRRFRLFKERLMTDARLLDEYCECKKRIILNGVSDTDEYAVQKRPFLHKALGREHALKDPNA